VHPLSRTIIERSPPRVRRPVTVAVRTVDTAMSDRLPGLAAEIAFWVVLSMPALLVAAIASASLIGTVNGEDWQTQLIDRIAEVASVALTLETIEVVVRPVLRSLVDTAGAGIVSFAFLVAVWVASRAVKVVLTTVAIVYGREGQRAPWIDRLLGFGVTIAALVVMTVIAPLLIAGPAFGEQLDDWVDLDLSVIADLWTTFYWPVVVLLATGALALLYHLAVPGRSRWRGDLPGAVLATGLWLLGSAGLRLYGAIIAETGSVYGPLAGPIVGLLWLWLTGLAVLLGAELNAQIELTRPERAGADEPTSDPDDLPRPSEPDDASATVKLTPTRDERRARRS
jgi:membrane protein